MFLSILPKITSNAVIKYNIIEIGDKRNKSGMEGNDWILSKPFPILDNKFKLDGIIGNEKYHFKIGFSPSGDILANQEKQC